VDAVHVALSRLRSYFSQPTQFRVDPTRPRRAPASPWILPLAEAPTPQAAVSEAALAHRW